MNEQTIFPVWDDRQQAVNMAEHCTQQGGPGCFLADGPGQGLYWLEESAYDCFPEQTAAAIRLFFAEGRRSGFLLLLHVWGVRLQVVAVPLDPAQPCQLKAEFWDVTFHSAMRMGVN